MCTCEAVAVVAVVVVVGSGGEEVGTGSTTLNVVARSDKTLESFMNLKTSHYSTYAMTSSCRLCWDMHWAPWLLLLLATYSGRSGQGNWVETVSILYSLLTPVGLEPVVFAHV